MNLKSLILDRFDEESLYILSKEYPSFQIDQEWKKRLESCDRDTYIPVLDFFLNNKIKKTFNIRSGLYNLRNCFPWRIAVIYDIRSGKVSSAEIRIGSGFGRYSLKGKNVIFNWLDVNENKKMLREVISEDSKSSLFSNKVDKKLTIQVRDLILNNKNLTLNLAVFNKNIQSFPKENPLREDFVVFPYSLSSNFQDIKLGERSENIITLEKVSIQFSPEVLQYLSVISY